VVKFQDLAMEKGAPIHTKDLLGKNGPKSSYLLNFLKISKFKP